jgi:hypothetical protein
VRSPALAKSRVQKKRCRPSKFLVESVGLSQIYWKFTGQTGKQTAPRPSREVEPDGKKAPPQKAVEVATRQLECIRLDLPDGRRRLMAERW